jgi:hypothetical protein
MDEMVYQGPEANPTFSATVVRWDSSLKNIHIINPIGTIRVNQFIYGQNSGGQTSVTEYLASPIRQYSGKILYINNTTSVVRSSNQTEQIRLAISLK